MSVMNAPETEDLDLREEPMTEEEKQQHLLANEDGFLERLLLAAEYATEETRKIDIVRDGKLYFSFSIHPISEEKINDIRKLYTKAKKDRRTGTVNRETDNTKFRSSMIYNSTTAEDKAKIWDSKKLKKALESKGYIILNALDVIDALLLPGEKSNIMDIIDDFNGYNSDEENIDEAKN